MLRVTRVVVGIQRCRLRASMWIAVDSPAEIGDQHNCIVVMAVELWSGRGRLDISEGERAAQWNREEVAREEGAAQAGIRS